MACRHALVLVGVSVGLLFSPVIGDQKPETDGKMRIAVLEFDIAEGIRIDKVVFADALAGTLQKHGNFHCVERRRILDVLKEQEFQIAMLSDAKHAARLGKVLGVRGLVCGSVGRVGREYVATCRLVDVHGGKVMTSSAARCRIGEPFSSLATQVVAEVLAAFPPEGFIIKVQETADKSAEAVLDLGKRHGVDMHTKFVVLEEHVIEHPRSKEKMRVLRKMGVLRPFEVDHDFAMAKVAKELAGKVKTGMRVRATTPIRQIKRAAMLGETFELMLWMGSHTIASWPVSLNQKIEADVVRSLYGTGFRVISREEVEARRARADAARAKGRRPIRRRPIQYRTYREGGVRIEPLPVDLVLDVYISHPTLGHSTGNLSAKLTLVETGQILTAYAKTVDEKQLSPETPGEIAKDIRQMLIDWHGKYQAAKKGLGAGRS